MKVVGKPSIKCAECISNVSDDTLLRNLLSNMRKDPKPSDLNMSSLNVR